MTPSSTESHEGLRPMHLPDGGGVFTVGLRGKTGFSFEDTKLKKERGRRPGVTRGDRGADQRKALPWQAFAFRSVDAPFHDPPRRYLPFEHSAEQSPKGHPGPAQSRQRPIHNIHGRLCHRYYRESPRMPCDIGLGVLVTILRERLCSLPITFSTEAI